MFGSDSISSLPFAGLEAPNPALTTDGEPRSIRSNHGRPARSEQGRAAKTRR